MSIALGTTKREAIFTVYKCRVVSKEKINDSANVANHWPNDSSSPLATVMVLWDNSLFASMEVYDK